MTVIAIIATATAIGYGLALILFVANDRRQKFRDQVEEDFRKNPVRGLRERFRQLDEYEDLLRSQGADQSEIDWLEWHRKLNEESYRALYGEQTPLGGKERRP